MRAEAPPTAAARASSPPRLSVPLLTLKTEREVKEFQTDEGLAAGIVVPRLPPPGVARSAQHGRRRFSTRSDYEAHLGRLQWVTAPEKTWEDAEVVAGVQRDWHMQGQTGCVFAQGLARKLPTEVWPSAVVPQVRGAGARVDAALATAIASPVAELLSVLFPTVDCSDALVGLLAELRPRLENAPSRTAL